jgi:NAD(P)H-dependent FMN reductase
MSIGIIIGSNRPGRNGIKIAEWVTKRLDETKPFDFEVLDLADINLPFLDEPQSPMMGNYQQPHTKAWAEKIAKHDGFIVITPEYNHSYPAVLKNAIDFLYAEWGKKAIGFVGYGVAGGTRAVEHLIPVFTQLNAVPLGGQVNIALFQQMDATGGFVPNDGNDQALDQLASTVAQTAAALAELRTKTA